MSELHSKSDLLKRQAELLGLTMEAVFTDEQAKEVLQGKITDAYLVKIKMDLDNKTGIILILASSIRKHILEVYSVFGSSTIFRRIRPFADFFQISTDLADIGKSSDGYDAQISESVGRIVYRFFTKEKLEEFLPLWEKKDPSRLSDQIEPLVLNGMKAGKAKLQAEIDKLSSAKFRFDNPMKGSISPIEKPQEEVAPAPELSSAPKAPTEMSSLERQIQLFRQNAQREIPVNTVISPISGVDFDNLLVGQEILFRIPPDHPDALPNATALGALDKEGKVSKEPIVGKFKGIASAKNEYHIFAEGPNQILLHSIEESPVKVATPKAIASVGSNQDKSGQVALPKKKPAEPQKTGNLYSLIGVFVALILIAFLVFILTAF
ncbi:hypothetical protein LPTSP4_26360 [Leptospira ryugenii]|uniref:Uncharacterized protein n=1 Tax=Leptospira ryugenii TaxID=1917863 RepID=A0A2P2E2G8_9LEPT|nr:hypothetical protein [Leptospira ryugenii]GBF51105.1 hypothetical protein LPTSP4_26360 [Leptospira ryugenii]